MADLAPVLIVMTIFATMGWIVHVFVDGRRRRERLKVFTEFHSRLIDRMGSAKEFAEFLQTTGGQNFLDTLSLERGHPADRIAKAVQVGIILTSVGLALFLATDRVATEIEGGYYVLATIILSLGIGFMLSAVSSFALARTFGLLHKAELRDELQNSRAWPDHPRPTEPPRS